MRRLLFLFPCLACLTIFPALAQSAPASEPAQPAAETLESVLDEGPAEAPADPEGFYQVEYAGGALTQDAIVALWQALPAVEDEPYAIPPAAQAPYAIGQLSPDYLESGLAYLNLIRLLAGLEPVTLSDHLCVQAQYGAVLLAANDLLTHSPGKPADMESSFFRMGANACAASNLSMRYGFSNHQLLTSALQGHMDEDSPLNRLDLGHRRWLLNPRLGQVGFGLAASAVDKQYITVPVTDQSQRAAPPDQVLWPAAGAFPNQLFSPGTPWSVILSGQVYQIPQEEELRVTVTRLRDGRRFVPQPLDGQSQLSSAGSYLLVSDKAYGSGWCVSFSIGKDQLGEDAYWGSYRVELTGLRLIDGTPAALTYPVEFFDAEAPSRPSAWAEDEVALALRYQLVPRDLQGYYDAPITRLEHCRLIMGLLRVRTGLDDQQLTARYGGEAAEPFWDCDDPEVLAAVSIGLIRGAGGKWFLPGGRISRQDAALLMRRAASLLERQPDEEEQAEAPPQEGEAAPPALFLDEHLVSPYAREAVQWVGSTWDSATGRPVMGGTGGGFFSPAAALTREQAILSALRLFRATVLEVPEI